jgi:hypothetical protein
MRHLGALVDQFAALARRHVGTEHNQRLVLKAGVLAIGVDDVVDKVGAVAAAAGGDENVVALGPMARHLVMRQASLQEADKIHLGAYAGRHFQPG